MFQFKRWFLLFVLLLATACAPDQVEPEAGSAGEIRTEAIPAAQQTLADFLGIAPDALTLDKIEEAEWGDSCLGLGGPAESCAAVITPGYLITFTAEDATYQVRTDLAGNQARVETSGEPEPAGDALPPAVAAARAALAQQLGVELEALILVNFEQREWGDSCLGLGGPAESCAAVITPGWVVTFAVEGQQHEVRTDLSGEQVRVADEAASEPAAEAPGPDMAGAVLFFQRSGGLAGQLLTVRIYADGTVERANGEPAPDMAVETMQIAPERVSTLLNELQAAGYFDLARSYLPQDSCCDRFLYLMGVQAGAGVHTVEALEPFDAAPEALGQSISLIEALLNETFPG